MDVQHEVSTCLRLLDDPDPTITAAIVKHLASLGQPAVPLLANAALSTENRALRTNIGRVIHEYQAHSLNAVLTMIVGALGSESDLDLEQALVMLNGFGHPAEDTGHIGAYLDDIAVRVHHAFIAMQPASDLTHLLALHSVMYEEEQFFGVSDNYYDPSNSYIASVVRRKRGLPVALACVQLMLAERIGLTLQGIAMPYHFVLYSPDMDAYIDAFQGGNLLSRKDCITFVNKSGLTFADSMLAPVSNAEIVIRILGNLVVAHTKSGNTWETEKLQDALQGLSFSQ